MHCLIWLARWLVRWIISSHTVGGGGQAKKRRATPLMLKSIDARSFRVIEATTRDELTVTSDQPTNCLTINGQSQRPGTSFASALKNINLDLRFGRTRVVDGTTTRDIRTLRLVLSLGYA